MLRNSWSMGGRDELFDVIRRVRNRWRMRVVLRGTAVVAAAGLAAFLLSSYGLEFFKFSAGSVIAFRVLTWLTLGGLMYWFLVRPLARAVPDKRVALYLEEHDPSLQAAVLSALEETKRGERTDSPDYSPALVDRLVQDAVEHCRALDWGAAVEREKIRRSSGYLVGVAAFALLAFILGPSYLRDGASALMAPTEVLARQHMLTLGELLRASRVRIALLAGGQSAAQRRETLASIAAGEVDVVKGCKANERKVEIDHG